MPIKVADNMVNTYAWIKATNNSKQYINIENRIDTTAVTPPTTAPMLMVMIKIKAINTIIIRCPAKILAKRRIIKAMGLVRVDIISIMGIKGNGTFNQVGTSGQITSL